MIEKKFCQVVNYDSEICSEPVVGVKEGIPLCKYHLAGQRQGGYGMPYPKKERQP